MGKSASKQFAEDILKAHNDYRKKHGVPPLKLCKKLNRGAQQYAEELAASRVLKHSSESANGKCGENLAWASYDQPDTSSNQPKPFRRVRLQPPTLRTGVRGRQFNRQRGVTHAMGGRGGLNRGNIS